MPNPHPNSLALALLATSAFAHTALLAQTPAQTHATSTATHQPRSAQAAARTTSAPTLPVTSVSLYKNGIGFFEHTAHVTGTQSVTIDLTTAQLNDVLQSLTAIDLNGGHIAGAGYNSTTPLDQQLRSLPLALGEQPTSSDLYNAIRGSRVEVTGSGAPFTGRILSLELRPTTAPGKPVTDADDTTTPEVPATRFLTLVAEDGSVRSVELTPSTKVRLLDQELHRDLARYLETLASNRADGLRHLTLEDRAPAGAAGGTRELHVSYISEVPVWKSTYRLLFTDAPSSANPTSNSKTSVTLQGWAVVDNTVGTDWTNVRLTLVTGSPQSFLQPLSQPIYSRRPEIPIAQDAQLTPQTYETGDASETKQPKEIAVAGMSGMGGAGGAIARGMGQGHGTGLGSGNGIGSGFALSSKSRSILSEPAAAPTISYEDAANASLQPQTTTAAFDDYFQYTLKDPVTIRKNESALVPVLQATIDAERVTLWTPVEPRAERALWITNTTGMTLDRGSFSVVENGSFGGEGLLDPIHAGERRLLSYAADDAVRVTPEGQNTTNRVTSITASKGVLVLHRDEVANVDYTVQNAAADPRTIVLEHPKRDGFTLDAANTPKPTETTSTAYRYTLEAAPGQTVKLHVRETRRVNASYVLSQSNEQQIGYLLSETNHNPELEQALQPILAARRRVAEAQTAVQQIEAELTRLRAEEDRQRANITALKDADKSAVQRFVNDMSHTEDQIAAANKELDTRNAALSAAQAELSNQIQSLQINETL
jgi:hypothetical protein